MFRKVMATLLALVLVLAASLTCAQAESYTIGFAVSTLENPFFVTMKDAAVAKAAELGVELVVLDAQDSAETQASQVEDFITRGVYGRISLCRMPNSAAVFSNSVCKSRLLLEKRLVNSKPLSVWTHSTRMPRRAYHAVSLRRKSAEE